MNIQEFLALEHPENFDFTDDVARNNLYRLLKQPWEKFFSYMALSRGFPKDSNGVLKNGADFYQECRERLVKVSDPDSNSNLLQEIYKTLWDEKILSGCKGKNKRIIGETLNSANTTLGVLYKYIETEKQKIERGNNRISIRYIISRYAEDKEKQISTFSEISNLTQFTEKYHSLGNFMPIPEGCNSPRGFNNPKVEDYWDLTLKIIYDYYVMKNDHLRDIVKTEKNYLNYKKWLDSFGAGQNGWNNFVEKNFLQDFVYFEESDYSFPKELWENHFSESVIPSRKEHIEQFYENATKFICARSNRMIKTLKEYFTEGAC